MRWGRPREQNNRLANARRQGMAREEGAGIPMVPHAPALISLAGVVFGPSRLDKSATGWGAGGLAAAD
jgi:hypothetical protein